MNDIGRKLSVQLKNKSDNEILRLLKRKRRKLELLENLLNSIDDLLSFDGTNYISDISYKKLLQDISYTEQFISYCERKLIENAYRH